MDRIVDQIVNPKLNSTFLPEVETVIYNCFGTTKAENEEEDLLNGNDDHSKNGDAHDQSIGGKISTRNLSTISSDTEMLNAEKTSGGSSPGPGLAGQVSPLTPGASPSVATGAISPLTPAGTPPGSAAASTTPSGTPPPPPPGESDDEIKTAMETETVEMEVDTEEPEEARPQSAYTPPLPQARPRTPPPLAPPPAQVGFAQPMPAPGANQSQPPPPPVPQDQESGGEASMSSISDTDLGDVSPPQPRKPPPVPEKPAEESSASASGTEDEDLANLMKMKAELMAQLEGDFKLSPEEDSEDEEPASPPPRPVVSGGENLSSDDNLLGHTPPPPGSIPAPPLSSSSGSPSPPPAKKDLSSPPLNPPGEEGSPSSLEDNVKEKLSITEGCKPSPQATGRSPRSPGDDGQGSGSGPGAGSSDQGRTESQSGSAEASGGSRGANSGEQSHSAKETQKSSHSHSHKSSKSSHHSSKSHSSRHSSSSSSSMSKEERRKMDKLKQQQREKIKKYEEKVKSKDRLKSDKFQALDIFSSKKPSTPYQPLKHRKSTGNTSGESTPTGPKPQKKEFEKKLDEAIKKELERREEEKKKKSIHDLKNKVSSSKIDDRRRSSDHERSSQKFKSKDQSTNKDNREKYSSSSRDKKDSSSSSRRESTDNKLNQVDRVKTDKSKSKHKESEGKKDRRISSDHNSSLKDKESKPKAKDEINELLKQKISSLGVDNIQKMLMESLVEKTGASISENEKQKMITKMEDMIKTESTDKPKPAVKTVKSPLKKRARSSSCSSSSGSSTSSSSSDSEEEQIVSKSIKAKLSPKKPCEPVKQRPVRQRKVNTFSVQSDDSDADSDFIKPVKEVEKPEPKILSPIRTSPNRPKADIDPNMKSFSFFEPEDVKKATASMKAYENLLSDENSVQVASVMEQDINDAIPSSRLVSLDYFKESEELIKNLEQFGGHPRLYKPVPDWLIPYLEGAKVKLEDVEMPHDHEIVDYLRKKETGRKKRKAGWDIVVDWVPQEQPQVKRSKLEKQLGFDFDSSFGCSIGSTDGKRSRRSAVKLGDTSMSSGEEAGVKENTSSDQGINRPSEVPSMETENDSAPVVIESKESLSKENIGKRSLRSINKAKQEQEVVGEADTSTDHEPESSSPETENKEPVTKDSEEQMNKEKLGDETSPGKKRRSRDIIAAYLTSAGVERANEESPGSGTASIIDTKSILDKLDVDIDEANIELNSIIDTLRNKKKRPQLGELKVAI